MLAGVVCWALERRRRLWTACRVCPLLLEVVCWALGGRGDSGWPDESVSAAWGGLLGCGEAGATKDKGATQCLDGPSTSGSSVDIWMVRRLLDRLPTSGSSADFWIVCRVVGGLSVFEESGAKRIKVLTCHAHCCCSVWMTCHSWMICRLERQRCLPGRPHDL